MKAAVKILWHAFPFDDCSQVAQDMIEDFRYALQFGRIAKNLDRSYQSKPIKKH